MNIFLDDKRQVDFEKTVVAVEQNNGQLSPVIIDDIVLILTRGVGG